MYSTFIKNEINVLNLTNKVKGFYAIKIESQTSGTQEIIYTEEKVNVVVIVELFFS